MIQKTKKKMKKVKKNTYKKLRKKLINNRNFLSIPKKKEIYTLAFSPGEGGRWYKPLALGTEPQNHVLILFLGVGLKYVEPLFILFG